MIEAVKKYFDAADEIQAEYNTAREGAPGGPDRDRRVRALQEIRDARRTVEWAKLKLSDDRLVAYIARKFGESRRGHAEIVLKALPLDADGLRNLGARATTGAATSPPT